MVGSRWVAFSCCRAFSSSPGVRTLAVDSDFFFRFFFLFRFLFLFLRGFGRFDGGSVSMSSLEDHGKTCFRFRLGFLVCFAMMGFRIGASQVETGGVLRWNLKSCTIGVDFRLGFDGRCVLVSSGSSGSANRLGMGCRLGTGNFRVSPAIFLRVLTVRQCYVAICQDHNLLDAMNASERPLH